MNWAAIIWLILLVVFIVAEAGTVTVTSIWFAIGAFAAMIAALLGAQVWLQVVLFIVVSGALLMALRPLTKKYLTPKLSRTNLDAVIGSVGVVTGRIDNITAEGKVKLGAMEWTARSADGSPIPKGTLVKVEKIEGVKVFVTAVEIKTAV